MRLFIIFFTFLLFISCAPEGTPVVLKPYDSIKAGAEIVESYNLSSMLNYSNVMDYSIHFSLYEDKFYIINNEKIIILNKNNLIKINEILFRIKILFWNLDTSYSNHNIDLAVFNNKMIFTYYLNFTNAISKITTFQIDISGDNLSEMDVSSDFGLSDINGKLGYNWIKDEIWILETNKINIFKAEFDKYNYLKTVNCEKLWFGETEIYDNLIWLSYGYFSSDGNEPIIEERNINFPDNPLRKITVAYLGTLSSPEDIRYDGEFLWIIIEKDGIMQLLKLKPL